MSKPKVIALMNQKGGVGKTTTTLFLAQSLSYLGHKVLIIDMDPQEANVSYLLNAEKENITTTADLFPDQSNEDIQIQDAIQTIEFTPGKFIDIVAAASSLSKVSSSQRIGVAALLRRHIQKDLPNDDYDYILIDTPPTPGVLTINAAAASDYIIIPTSADSLGIESVDSMIQTIGEIREYYNPDINILGILLTRYRSRTNSQKAMKETIEQIAEKNKVPIFNTYIRESVVIQEAQHNGSPIYEYKSGNPASEDYVKFAIETIELLKNA